MPRQLAQLTLETTPGVFPTGSIPDANQVLLDLPISNAMTVRARPEPIVIRSAAGSNRRVKQIAGRRPVTGDITAHLRPSQAPFFLKLLAGITLTGDACYNLPTFSIDHAIYLHDGACTPVRRRYLGCVATGTLSGASEGDAQLLMVKLSIFGRQVAAISGTDFPIPAFADYAEDDPYLFHQSAGFLVIREERVNYKNFTVNFNNVNKPFSDESLYYGHVGWFGRNPSLEATLMYKDNQDRTDFEESTTFPMSLAFDDGTTRTSLDFQANNAFSAVEDDLPIDDYYTQRLVVENMLDLEAGTDMVITVAPTPVTP